MPSRWNDRWNVFPESRPRPTVDGITTSKQRGAMADSWWSQRFVAVLESYGLGARMARGRRYARTGQVVSLAVRAGKLVAQVQGSRARPYVVIVEAEPPSTAQWKKIDAALASRVGFAAQLLAGEVPPELEAVFRAAKTSLLPTTWAMLDCSCTCPDWENPCKHIAAVLYVFADQLDTDPWQLLEWRGRTRDEALEPLRRRARGRDRAGAPAAAAPVAPWWPFADRETLPVVDAREVSALVEPADPPDAVLARCADLAVDAQGVPVTERLRVAYRALSVELAQDAPPA